MALIVFDLDGTLIDSAPDIQAIANSILASEGCSGITLQDTRNFIGNGASVFVQKMREHRKIPSGEHQRLLDMFIEQYKSAVQLTKPFAGVNKALNTLKAHGHRLGVCTNKPITPTHNVLNHLELSHYFDTVWGGDSMPVRKPDPAPLNAAFDALGDGLRVYVGDSEVDAQTALNADVSFVLYTEGYRKKPVEEVPHSTTFSNYADLPMIIDSTV